jgi:hypothetical protein
VANHGGPLHHQVHGTRRVFDVHEVTACGAMKQWRLIYLKAIYS